MGALKNGKHDRFCQEYVVDHNGTAAAERAGYSTKNAAAQATALMKRPEVLERIRELQAEQARRLCLTADRVVLEILTVYRRCMQQEPVMIWDSDRKEYVESGEYTFKERGALQALDLLGKYLGMWTEKVAVTTVDDETRRKVAELIHGFTGERA